jgi:hypothetical protein
MDLHEPAWPSAEETKRVVRALYSNALTSAGFSAGDVAREIDPLQLDLTFLDRASPAKRLELVKAVLEFLPIAPYLLKGDAPVLRDYPSEAEVERVLNNAEARRRRAVQ